MDVAGRSIPNAGAPKDDVFAEQLDHDLDDGGVRRDVVERPRGDRMSAVSIQRGFPVRVANGQQKLPALLRRQDPDGTHIPLLGKLVAQSSQSVSHG